MGRRLDGLGRMAGALGAGVLTALLAGCATGGGMAAIHDGLLPGGPTTVSGNTVALPPVGVPAGPPGTGEAPAGSPLAGRYFTGQKIISTSESKANYFGVAFLDETWAYWGRPEAGFPACDRQTATVSTTRPADGWGCVPYTFDPGTGRLEVGPLTGTYRDGTLTLNDWAFIPMHLPDAGSRYDLSLIHRGHSGLCGPYSTCTTWSTVLVLTADGYFALSDSSMSTIDGGDSYSMVSSRPPDEWGSYEVLAGGRIELSFESGETSARTFSIVIRDGRPDPLDTTGSGGLVLGTDRFRSDSD